MAPKHQTTFGFPTLLILENHVALRRSLSCELQREGFHVLEAQNSAYAMEIVRTHSRPIHLLLMDVSFGTDLAAELQQYRQQMTVLFLDVPTLEPALQKVRDFFQAAQEHCVGTQA